LVAYNGFCQLANQFGHWLFGGGSNSEAAAQQRVLELQMEAEVARRQAEAERLHQEEEARRLATMYKVPSNCDGLCLVRGGFNGRGYNHAVPALRTPRAR
jgi:hypothetical protein